MPVELVIVGALVAGALGLWGTAWYFLPDERPGLYLGLAAAIAMGIIVGFIHYVLLALYAA